MEKLMRSFFLFAGRNKWCNRMAKKYGLRLGAGRFVAGVTLESALQTIEELNKNGMMVTIDHLGEFVQNEDEAEEMANKCIEALEGIADHNVDSNLSLKLTSMGLDISKELCLRNMTNILSVARKNNIFVRIDMEDYAHLDLTLYIFEQLKKEYDNVGLVLQSYLHRTLDDLQKLIPEKTNLRLVKGAYKESPKVAYEDKKEVDQNFIKLIEQQLLSGNYAGIATHDDAIIESTKSFVEEHQISLEQFEFQMLYGIRTELQKQLINEGFRVRIYVPYGKDWYGYFMRRLAERPANVVFVIKGIIKK
jgi:proline dehydrogenase